MGRMKKMLCIIVILVFGVTGMAAASTYPIQPASSDMYALDGSGAINWSGLFDSIEEYTPASDHEFYTHTLDAAPGGAFTGGVSGGGIFAGQGMSMDSWGNLSATDQPINGKVATVVAALAGLIGTEHHDFGFIPHSDRHLSFNTFGETCNLPQVPLPGSLWFLFSGFGTALATRRWWRM